MARILVIDDEPHMVSILSTFLGRRGHLVVSAGNGEEGLEKLAKNCFDIVIIDIIMPVCDDFEALTSIMKMPKRPKIIAISGGSPYYDQEYLLDVPEKMAADAVMPKPLRLPNLSETIIELLNGS
jgi:CheY-like chemotaxis protein